MKSLKLILIMAYIYVNYNNVDSIIIMIEKSRNLII